MAQTIGRFPLLLLLLAMGHGDAQTFSASNDAGLVVTFHPIRLVTNTAGDTESNSLSVLENMPIGTTCGIVQVFTSHHQLAQDVTCSLNGNDSFDLFTLVPGVMQLKTGRVLDRESQAFIAFLLECVSMSQGDPVTMHLRAEVGDMNDNMPIFQRAHYSFSLSEYSQLGAFVGQCVAVDQDVGHNSLITYSVNTHDFHIDSSGRLYLIRHLDRELQTMYRLVVTARDMGRSPLEGTTEVVIHVLDENDNAPQSARPEYDFTVVAGSAVGTVVGVIPIIDADEGRNAEVTAILQDSPDSNLFSLQQGPSFTGFHLLTTGQLGSDHVGTHTLTVVASDRGQPSRSTTIPVRVTVTSE